MLFNPSKQSSMPFGGMTEGLSLRDILVARAQLGEDLSYFSWHSAHTIVDSSENTVAHDSVRV
jgi:hypothetical protein